MTLTPFELGLLIIGYFFFGFFWGRFLEERKKSHDHTRES